MEASASTSATTAAEAGAEATRTSPPPLGGWTFRLNFPAWPVDVVGDDGAGDGSGSGDVDVDGGDGEDDVEGVELLPKAKEATGRGGDRGGGGGCLAELSPRGARAAAPAPTAADGAAADGGVSSRSPRKDRSKKWSWSYSSPSPPSRWHVTSGRLLSATYRPAREARPAHTNISAKRECWHRSVGRCLCGECSGCGSDGDAAAGGSRGARGRRGGRNRWKEAKRRMSGAPNPIHRVQVDYNVEDVLHVEPIVASSSASSSGLDSASEGGLWIRGVGNCHALRIYLRPKFGSSASGSGGGGDDKEESGLVEGDSSDLPPMEKWDNLPSPPWTAQGNARGGSSETNGTKPHGPIITFAIPRAPDDEKGSALRDCPPLLWKVDHPPNPHVAIDSWMLMDGALHLHQHKTDDDGVDGAGGVQDPSDSMASSSSYDYDTPTNVYIHGYQSWSFSGSVVQGEAQPKSAMPDVFSAAFNRGGVVLTGNGDQTYCGGGDRWSENMASQHDEGGDAYDEELDESTAFYKSDMFACVSSNGAASPYDDERILLDEEGGPALIVGFLSQRQQYGVVLLDKDLRHFNLYACHEGVVAKRSVASDWAYCQIVDGQCYDEEAMVYYVHAAADHNEARAMEKGLTCGWCSWYHYYADIDHDSLSKNAHILEKNKSSIGFNVCLVDDGYMTAWGDWTSLKPGKFVKDGGMRVLADAIRSKGMKPGVWLAPFACDKSSKLAKDHPDWIIRNDRGRYANSANCGKFFYGLDATNPAVRKYVFDAIRRAVDEWGFEVLKLDFLYASCLQGNGKYDATMSRAEAMHLGLRTIRAAAGDDTFIIGCGCPIGSAIGFVDGMRVSCDTGPTFVPEFPLPHWDNGTLPALRGMLRNTMSRAPFGHRWWHNDPDCILLGDSTKLTDNEVVSAASIVAMTGGMFLLSDDMEKVSQARLTVAKRIFPLTGVTAVPLDLHSTINGGMPSILRLWCAEKATLTNEAEEGEVDNIGGEASEMMNPGKILHEQASKIECEVGYSPGNNVDPYSRERSCFPVAPGLGSWTVVSLSNWMDGTAKLSVSFAALVSHSIEDFVAMGAPRSVRSLDTGDSTPGEMSEYGFHVFSFWASEYVWIPHQTLVENNPLRKQLEPHETEIFHIKPANPTRPQYIGSDLHFSCGFEVKSFDWGDRHVNIALKNDYKKEGSIFVYLPERKGLDKADVAVNGNPGIVEIVARPSIGDGHDGRVMRIHVEMQGSATDDGIITIRW
ncbi:hypothetical protein ACHAWF_013296 [Thalassiosira exigua]